MNRRPRKTPRRRPPAFTLVELMVVIGIIVLIIGLAVPAFNAISGNRSAAAAENVAAATLGVARQTAIANQEPVGLFFFIDPTTGRGAMAFVGPDARNNADATGGLSDYIDILPNSEIVPLPAGTGVQFLVSPVVANKTVTDRYLGFGLIRFNPDGSYSAAPFSIALADAVGTPNVGVAGKGVSLLGTKLGLKTLWKSTDFPIVTAGQQLSQPVGPALAFYDAAAYAGQGDVGDYSVAKNNYVATGAPDVQTETNKETWLDANATVVLINQSNGTLVKGK